MFKKNLATKLAALLVSGGLKEFKKIMSSDEVGGTAPAGHLPARYQGPRLLRRLRH